MKKFYFVILLVLPLLSAAQSNYKKGCVVNLNGDTLRGYIDYREWGRNPKNVNFKTALGARGRLLGPAEISYFEIDGDVSYHRFKVAISLNTVDISSPSSAADTSSVTDAIFLKILQKGKYVTLYAYKDGLKERFYIKESDMEVPAELRYGIYEDPNSDKIISQETYKAQLNQIIIKYSPDGGKLIKQVQRAAYRADDLADVAAQINGNTQTQVSSASGKNAGVRFFAGGAVISSTLKDAAYYGSPASRSVAPKISVGVDAIVNPAVGHLIFRLELAYAVNNFSFTDRPDPVFNIADPDISYIKIKQNVVYITPQVIYNIYNTDALKIFVDLGYSVNLLSYPSTQVTTYNNEGLVSSKQSKQFSASRGYYGASQFKVGLVLSRMLEIYAAYYPSANISNTINYSINLASYQAGINYYFGSRK